MTIRILHSSYVINFLDIQFNSDDISDKLLTTTVAKFGKFTNEKLTHWEAQFRLVYGEGDRIRIYKSIASYIKEKQKLITIHIPIPSIDVVDWGVENSQFISIGHPSNAKKNVTYLNVNFRDFENRTDFIMDCAERAILFCFKEGFTVNGVKVIVEDIPLP